VKECSVEDDGAVLIGMDPHKRSVTIEVMSSDESIVGRGRFATDVEGFSAMLSYVAAWTKRVWAIEGCEGIGRHVAQRPLPRPRPSQPSMRPPATTYVTASPAAGTARSTLCCT
jgi:hypothetical protein